MLRLLSERESGIMSPLLLQRAQIARRYFNLELSKHIEVEEVYKGSVNSLDLDQAEHRYLLSGGSDSTLAIHDTQGGTGTQQQTYPLVCQVSHSQGGPRQGVETVQWYPVDTGLFTSSGADRQLKIWDTNLLKVADTFTFSSLVTSHHMSPVARKHCLVAVAASRSMVSLVDMKSGSATHQLKGHSSFVSSVRWSTRHEFLLASGGSDKKVILWDVRKARGNLMVLDQHGGHKKRSGESSEKTAHDGTVNCLRFTPDGLHLVTFGTDDQVRLWGSSYGDLLPVNYGRVTNSVKKAVQMDIVTDSAPPILFVPSDSTICLYDLFRGEHLGTLSGHYNLVNCCVSHPHTQFLFSGGTDRNLLVWTPPQHHADDDDKSPSGQGERKRDKTLTADAWSSDDEGT